MFKIVLEKQKKDAIIIIELRLLDASLWEPSNSAKRQGRKVSREAKGNTREKFQQRWFVSCTMTGGMDGSSYFRYGGGIKRSHKSLGKHRFVGATI